MRVFNFWRFVIFTNFWKLGKDAYRSFGFYMDLYISPKSGFNPYVWEFEIKGHFWRYGFKFFIGWKAKK
jgi:hypothetical protein